jgi:hypothetical protein
MDLGEALRALDTDVFLRGAQKFVDLYNLERQNFR